mmetsp:Transcript_86999/g.245391  ORF Transcript_86999/g.245391 Transcript_86999/m.245391 type:complete len:230 (+) Transcript_86999:296-985(+)
MLWAARLWSGVEEACARLWEGGRPRVPRRSARPPARGLHHCAAGRGRHRGPRGLHDVLGRHRRPHPARPRRPPRARRVPRLEARRAAAPGGACSGGAGRRRGGRASGPHVGLPLLCGLPGALRDGGPAQPPDVGEVPLSCDVLARGHLVLVLQVGGGRGSPPESRLGHRRLRRDRALLHRPRRRRLRGVRLRCVGGRHAGQPILLRILCGVRLDLPQPVVLVQQGEPAL